LFLLQQGVIYAMPLVVGDENLAKISSGSMAISGATVGLLFAAATAGFHGARSTGAPPRPSRWSFYLRGSSLQRKKAIDLCLTLLASSLAFHLATRSGLLYEMLPGKLWSLFPVLRAGSDAASMFGALIGGIYLSSPSMRARSVAFWAMLLGIFFLSISDVLLSAATGLILATAVGLALGRSRFPWAFFLAAFCLLGFLNQGKFMVREKYWDPESHSTHLKISELPSFYLDWASTSLDQLIGSEPENPARPDFQRIRTEAKPDGQSLLDRIDNFQILNFAVDSIRVDDKPVLMGKTYGLIPPLLIPRFLWPDKPRTHEGQVILNLHFERQQSREETEKTYIAWGLLPESIGNFGPFGGPIIFGLAIGWLFGFLERFSYRKELFSIEGLLLIAFLLKVVTSFEMVSSVFVTSTFQFLVIVAVGGYFLRLWFLSGASLRTIRSPGHHSIQ
ncbi:MAG: hypothetical protein AAGC68_17975, partial [Verrucomicrobiota bacterium]